MRETFLQELLGGFLGVALVVWMASGTNAVGLARENSRLPELRRRFTLPIAPRDMERIHLQIKPVSGC